MILIRAMYLFETKASFRSFQFQNANFLLFDMRYDCDSSYVKMTTIIFKTITINNPNRIFSYLIHDKTFQQLCEFLNRYQMIVSRNITFINDVVIWKFYRFTLRT